MRRANLSIEVLYNFARYTVTELRSTIVLSAAIRADLVAESDTGD